MFITRRGILNSGAIATYWINQSEVIGYYDISKLSAGKIYNQVVGRTSEYLSVSGTAGSYHYTCPNTTGYTTADVDNCWFKGSGAVSDMTDSRLNSYDFLHTIVKYDNTSPYTNRIIMILKTTVATGSTKENRMRTDFQLSLWWSNVSSGYGKEKGNRAGEQAIWTKEPEYVLMDYFTAADNTTLDAHTMTMGTGWTQNALTAKIMSNKMVQNPNSSISGKFTSDAGKADVDISMDIDLPAGNLKRYTNGIILRWQDATYFMTVYVACDVISPAQVVYLMFASLDGTTESISLSAELGVTRTLRVVASGNNIKSYWNGALKHNRTSTYNNTKTKVGILEYVTGTADGAYVVCPVDNFLVL